MLNKSFFLLLLSMSLRSQDVQYDYTFFIGRDKICVTYIDNLPIVSFNGERITCACGNAPTSIITIDDEICATCKNCKKVELKEIIVEMPVLDEEQELELERRALRYRSHRNSPHRSM